jgi:hypothetical protein
VAISRVGSASAQATTITIPTHQSGDLILIVATRNNSAAATVPSGWVTLSNIGSGGISFAIGWKLAKSSSETSGTWTNASAIHCAVYRGSAGVLAFSTASTITTATSATVQYGALANYRAGVLDNWYVGTAFQLNSTNSLETAPTGMTNVNVESSAGNWKSVLHDTNASQLSNWASTNVAVTTSATWRAAVLQLFEFDGPAFGGGGGIFFRPGMSGGMSE